jgi:hypothetical protein
MFVRFRQAGHRLQASLIETRRVDCKVRHEHIAMLGSIIMPPSISDRITFWTRLHERLAKLSNRVDAADQGKIMGAVHARVPMVTPDEQRALQLENAKADVKFWDGLADMHAATAQEHKGLAATAERAAAAGEIERAKAAEHAELTKDRIARIERGENVSGGLGKPMTREDFERELIKVGFTKEHLRHCEQVNEVSKALGFEALKKAILDAKDRSERRVVRGLHREVLRRERS